MPKNSPPNTKIKSKLPVPDRTECNNRPIWELKNQSRMQFEVGFELIITPPLWFEPSNRDQHVCRHRRVTTL